MADRVKPPQSPPAIGPTLAFIGLLTVLLVASSLAISLGMTAGLEGATASVGARICSAMGMDVWLRGADIVSEARTLRVGPECSILNFLAVFIALVSVTGTASWKDRARYMLIGVLLIWVADVVRLVFAAYVAISAPGVFDWLHTYAYPAVLTLMIIVLWVVWTERGVAGEK